jgi:hypothetical protein
MDGAPAAASAGRETMQLVFPPDLVVRQSTAG